MKSSVSPRTNKALNLARRIKEKVVLEERTILEIKCSDNVGYEHSKKQSYAKSNEITWQ